MKNVYFGAWKKRGGVIQAGNKEGRWDTGCEPGNKDGCRLGVRELGDIQAGDQEVRWDKGWRLQVQ